MPVAERTIKSLFAKSQNRCAVPDCHATLVVGESTVLGEICHIRARRKGGPRFDAGLTPQEKDAAANLILLCPTCHTLIDKDRTGAFSVDWLESIKAQHEHGSAFEITPSDAAKALALLAHSKEQKRPQTKAGIHSKADRGGVAISFDGSNHGTINVRTSSSSSRGRGYAKNSIGADANLRGYIDDLCELYVSYMSPSGISADEARKRIGKNIKDAFRLRRRTRNDLPAERFDDLVIFLRSKLARTPVGQKHIRRGTKLCSTFAEWRTTTR